MATSPTKPNSSDCLRRFPLRRIEPFLVKCLQKLEVKVNDLHEHKLTLAHLSSSDEGGKKLSVEYTKAIESVHQLTLVIRQLEQTRQQVDKDDIPTVDFRLTSAFSGLLMVLYEFLQKSALPPLNDNTSLITKDQLITKSVESNQVTSETDKEENVTREADDECQQLELKLLELNDMVQKLLEQMDHKPVNAEDAVGVESSQPDKHTALHLPHINLKLLMMPVAGAVLGGAIAGPVGLVAGLKVGKIAAVSGGIIGLTGGTLLKKHKEGEPHTDQDGGQADAGTNELEKTNPLMNVM